MCGFFPTQPSLAYKPKYDGGCFQSTARDSTATDSFAAVYEVSSDVVTHLPMKESPL